MPKVKLPTDRDSVLRDLYAQGYSDGQKESFAKIETLNRYILELEDQLNQTENDDMVERRLKALEDVVDLHHITIFELDSSKPDTRNGGTI